MAEITRFPKGMSSFSTDRNLMEHTNTDALAFVTTQFQHKRKIQSRAKKYATRQPLQQVSFPCEFEIKSNTSYASFQEGDRVTLYVSPKVNPAQSLPVSTFVIIQIGSQYYWYFGESFHPLSETALPALEFTASSNQTQAVPFFSTVVPVPSPPLNMIVWVYFSHSESSEQVAPITQYLLTINPGASAFTGILDGKGIIEKKATTLNPDGGNPIQGLNFKRLPTGHWFYSDVWNQGNADYGFFNTHTPYGYPAVEVVLRSAFIDHHSLNDYPWRNDAWFHFRINIPQHVKTEEIVIYLRLKQQGIGNFYILGYSAYDWRLFRPVIRTIDSAGNPLEGWHRIEGQAVDDFTFQFKIPAVTPQAMFRSIEVAQMMPYPPSRIERFITEIIPQMKEKNIEATVYSIGFGGLSAENIDPSFREQNPINALWIYTGVTTQITQRPTVVVTIPHLEPTANFVAEGIVHGLMLHPEYLLKANYLFFLNMNPDSKKWGITEVFPASGLNSSWWWFPSRNNHEDQVMQNYFNELLEQGFQMGTYLELHCEVAPREHTAQWMPIHGYYEVTTEEERLKVEQFVAQLQTDAEFGAFFRDFSDGWQKNDPWLLVAPPPSGFGFKQHLIIELPEIAFYKKSATDSEEQFEVDHYLEDEQELVRLGFVVAASLSGQLT